MGMTQDELERQQVRQQSRSTRTENSQASRTEEGKSTTGEQGTTRTEYENLDPVELMRRGRQAYVDDYIQARGGYPTLEETLGVDPQRLEEYRKRQEKLNEFKRKEAMWYNGLSVLGDVLTGAFGGNVWQRTPGKDAENARKANEQIELDRMNDAAKVNQARRAIQEEANKSWESLISKYMSTYKPSSTRTTEANREQNTTSRVNTTGNNTQNITENGTKEAPMATGSGSGKGGKYRRETYYVRPNPEMDNGVQVVETDMGARKAYHVPEAAKPDIIATVKARPDLLKLYSLVTDRKEYKDPYTGKVEYSISYADDDELINAYLNEVEAGRIDPPLWFKEQSERSTSTPAEGNRQADVPEGNFNQGGVY